MEDAPPSRPRRRDASRSRQAILDAAERLFATRGYDSTTMAEIGSAAGLSVGAPAYFFRSKEELYRAVLGRAFDETSSLVRATDLVGTAFEEALKAGVSAYVDFLAARPNFVRLVVRECLEGGRHLQGLPEHLAAIGEALPRLVDQRGRGRLREGTDPAHLLLSTISLCWFPMVAVPLTRDLGFETDSVEFLGERKHQIIELLLRGALGDRGARPSADDDTSR
jgi:AcrR family transcriptional regulator